MAVHLSGGGGGVSAHSALTGLTSGDDHTQYRLETADHTHQSTGAQAGQLDHGAALTGLTDDDHVAYLRIETSRTGTQPASVGTTPGTAATAFQTWQGGTGGNTSIITTGVGGIGGGLAITLGTGGAAALADTASTGGKGGGAVWTMGPGGAAAAAGTNVGGAGGDWEVIGGAGGAASGGTGNTGGVGGSVYIVGGAAGTGGSPAVGNVYLGRTSGGTARGQVIFANGTAAAPGLAFTAGTDIGFEGAAGVLWFSHTGVRTIGLYETGMIIVPTNLVAPARAMFGSAKNGWTGITQETPLVHFQNAGATTDILASGTTIALQRDYIFTGQNHAGVAGGGTETITTLIGTEIGLPAATTNITLTNAAVALRSLGSIILGDVLPPAAGPTNTFIVASGTAPTSSPADSVTFYSSDDAADHTIPSFYCEGTNVVATAQADSVSSVRIKMRFQGTVYTFLCI